MSARQAPATKPTYPVPITVIFINSLNFDTATKKWCRNSELNQGHRDFQSLALPTELLRLNLFTYHFESVGRASSTFLTPSLSLLWELLRLNLFTCHFYSVGRASSTFLTPSLSRLWELLRPYIIKRILSRPLLTL